MHLLIFYISYEWHKRMRSTHKIRKYDLCLRKRKGNSLSGGHFYYTSKHNALRHLLSPLFYEAKWKKRKSEK